jgi:Cys-rich protein (TIGR01571 family)
MVKPSGQAHIHVEGEATTGQKQEQGLPGASFLAIGAKTRETAKQKQPAGGMRTVMHQKQAGIGRYSYTEDEGVAPLQQVNGIVHVMHQAGVRHYQQRLQASDDASPIVESVIVPHHRNKKEHRRHIDHVSPPSHLRKVAEGRSEEESQQPSWAVSGDAVNFAGEPLETQSDSIATTDDEDGTPRTPLEYWARYPSTMASLYMVYILFVVLAAFLYTSMQSSPRKARSPLEDEAHGDGCFDNLTLGLFDVRQIDQDWPNYMMACFCPAVRWAGTVSAEEEAPVLGFWAALLLVLALNLLGPVTNGATCLLLVPLAVYFRQRFRRHGGESAQTPTTVALDVLAWALCPCCALVQEAREAERGSHLATKRSQYLLPKAQSSEEAITDYGQVGSFDETTMVPKFVPAPENNEVKNDEELPVPEPDHRERED